MKNNFTYYNPGKSLKNIALKCDPIVATKRLEFLKEYCNYMPFTEMLNIIENDNQPKNFDYYWGEYIQTPLYDEYKHILNGRIIEAETNDFILYGKEI